MLSSHNSLSYLTPKKWWMKLLTPWAKCQNKTISQQYDAGVRYFDFRVAFSSDSSVPIFVHNIVKYRLSYKEFLNIMRYLDSKGDVMIRFILDIRKTPSKYKVIEEFFNRFLVDMSYNFQHIEIEKAIVFWSWTYLIDKGEEIDEYHASVSAPWYQYVLGTKWFAKHKAHEYYEIHKKENKVIMIDYI